MANNDRAIIQQNLKTITGQFKNKILNFRSIAEKIEVYLQSQYILAFQKQGRKTKWEPRSVPNLPGIIRDLEKGGNISKRRFDPRPALIDTGRLKNSGATRIVGDTIYWGTNVPYAGLHQWGGTSEFESYIPAKKNDLKIQAAVRQLKKKGYHKEALMLTRRKRWVIKVPARPFLELTEEDYLTFQEIIAEEMV